MYTIYFVNRARELYKVFYFDVPARQSVLLALARKLYECAGITPARYEWRRELEESCATLFTYHGAKFMKVEQTAEKVFEVQE